MVETLWIMGCLPCVHCWFRHHSKPSHLPWIEKAGVQHQKWLLPSVSGTNCGSQPRIKSDDFFPVGAKKSCNELLRFWVANPKGRNRGFPKIGLPLNHHPNFRWDFPQQKPSSELGDPPMAMESPIWNDVSSNISVMDSSKEIGSHESPRESPWIHWKHHWFTTGPFVGQILGPDLYPEMGLSMNIPIDMYIYIYMCICICICIYI